MNTRDNSQSTMKNVALFLAAPFVGLTFIAAAPFIGIAALAWFGARALLKSSAPGEADRKSASDELSAEQLEPISGGHRGGGISGDFRCGPGTGADLGSALLGGGLGVNPSVG